MTEPATGESERRGMACSIVVVKKALAQVPTYSETRSLERHITYVLFNQLTSKRRTAMLGVSLLGITSGRFVTIKIV